MNTPFLLFIIGIVAFCGLQLYILLHLHRMERELLLAKEFFQSPASPRLQTFTTESNLSETDRIFYDSLSVLETKVVIKLIEGRSNSSIAEELDYTVGYVYNLKSMIKRKHAEIFPHSDFDSWLKSKLAA